MRKGPGFLIMETSSGVGSWGHVFDNFKIKVVVCPVNVIVDHNLSLSSLLTLVYLLVSFRYEVDSFHLREYIRHCFEYNLCLYSHGQQVGGIHFSLVFRFYKCII